MMQSKDVFLKTLNGEKSIYTPVWFMRQAGRFLKEYQQLKQKYTLNEMFTNRELITEVTLLPDKLGVDALIIFSDILIPLKTIGAKLNYKDGYSPVVELQKLEYTKNWDELDFLWRAIGDVKNIKPNKALLGFAGAPFTLLCYVFGGQEFYKLRAIMHEDPRSFSSLMDTVTEMTIDYLNLQLKNGCDAVQLFDSWAGLLNSEIYEKLVLPFNQKIAEKIKPSIYFIKNSYHLNSLLKKMDFNAFSVDWRSNLVEIYNSTKRCVQGNLDNTVLFSSLDTIKSKTKEILEQTKSIPHIFNLGHGVLPNTDEYKLKELVNFVHETTYTG